MSNQIQLRERASYSYCTRSWRQQTNPSRKKFSPRLFTQDEIARIRKRKRGRNMLNRSGNTTDNLCFRYRFRDVFSRFRCCVYNGTGPLLRKHNGNMELHVSAKFPFTDSCNSVLCNFGILLLKNWLWLRHCTIIIAKENEWCTN